MYYKFKRVPYGWELTTDRTEYSCVYCGAKVYPPFYIEDTKRALCYCGKCVKTKPLVSGTETDILLYNVQALKIEKKKQEQED